MGTNFYQHSLLWSEDRKRAERKREVEQDLRFSNYKKEIAKMQLNQEREDFKNVYHKHNPWGKPGGGAPNHSVRMRNIKLDGLYPETGQDCRNFLPPYRYKVKRGGGGAPIRSASGRLLAPYREDPILGFNDPTRNYVDIELRYKTTPDKQKRYKMQLDNIVSEKEKEKAVDAKNSVENDRMLNAQSEPWGKVGPGGMPWRNPRNVGDNFMNSMGWTTKDTLQSLDETKEFSTNKNQVIETCTECICSCATKKQTAQRNVFPYVSEATAKYKKPDIKSMGNSFQQKHHHKKSCIEPRARPCMITSGVELVPLLAKRRAQQRPISLSSTDVTKLNKNDANYWRDGGVQYLDDLCRQMNRKKRDFQINKQRDLESSQEHFETWDTFWGRPGGGASRATTNRMNLDDLLYKQPLNRK